MTINTLEEKFLTFLSGAYISEQRFLELQQELAEQATDEALKLGLQNHLAESQKQIANLDRAFQILQVEPIAVPSQHVEGAIAESRQLLQSLGDNPVVIDSVIADLQGKVEHLEIACYRELIIGARWLGQHEVVEILQQILQQEEHAAELVEGLIPQLLEKAVPASPEAEGVKNLGRVPLMHTTATGENLDETTVRAENEDEAESGGLIRS